MANTYQKGDKDTRPWGTWEVLDAGDGFCVKHIKVSPHSMISLQSHNFRSEHWIIIKGQAVVTLDDAKLVKKMNDAVFIPLKTKHRIQNDTDIDVEFIEIQAGDNLDEDDIIRYEDIYGRV